MKRFKINIEGGETVTVVCPADWEEVTVGMFVRLEKDGWNGKDVLHLLSILSGTDLGVLDNIHDQNLYKIITESLAFITKDPPDFDRLPIKDTVVLNGRSLEVPKDLEMEPLGQKILMTNLMQADNMILQIAEAIAIYFQPIYDESKSFDRERLPIIKQMVNREPIMTMYPVVSFFLQKLREYKRSGKEF